MKIFYDGTEKPRTAICIRESNRDPDAETIYVINGSLSTREFDGYIKGKVEKLSLTNRDYDNDLSRVFVWEFNRITFRAAWGNTTNFTALSYADPFDGSSPLHYFTDPLPVEDPEWYYPPKQPQRIPVMELDIEVLSGFETIEFNEWLNEHKDSWV